MAIQGTEGVADRVSAETLEAASPMISTARTTAKRNMTSLSRSLRCRPSMNCPAVSAASIMWRSRMVSSGFILHLGRPYNLLAKIAAQVLGGAQIHLASAQQAGQ